MVWSRKAPLSTTSIFAESRGCAGRNAMRSGGKSKSKRSVRIADSGPHSQTLMVRRRGAPSRIMKAEPQQRGLHLRDARSALLRMRVERLRRVSGHPRLDDLVGVLHGLAALDLVDVLHALGHLAPHRVLVVEGAGVGEHDK